MYLLYDHKTSSPISCFVFSTILHALVFLFVTNLAMKMAELKPLKKEVIEFELATKVILTSVLPTQAVAQVLEPVSVEEAQAASALAVSESAVKASAVKASAVSEPAVNIQAANTKVVNPKAVNSEATKIIAEKVAVAKVAAIKVAAVKVAPVKATPVEAVPAPVEQDEDFTPKEDFARMDLKGEAWQLEADADADAESAPDLKEQEDNSDSSEAYLALNKKYEAEDVDADLSAADQNNAEYARRQEEQVVETLDKDTKALAAHADKYIENEKKKGFIAPPSKVDEARGTSTERSVGGGRVVGNPTTASTAGSNKKGASVRALRELQQMVGNKKPQYTIADRRASKQGDVIYHAFINPKGMPERFVLIKSSGHQSLDENTLDTLKKWKFYPGQEGWVELPFHWSLTGGAVEAPSLLRR